jgi:preprotein translocase subunit YajC
MPASEANPVVAFMPLVLMFVIFYFLLIRPQQKKEKDRQKMIGNLKKGDRVVTTGGLLGTVVGLKDDIIVLKVGDGETKIEFLKSAISNLSSTEKA